jgi:hypothetical protein
MRLRNGLSFWRVCVLGALNGLLYGEVAEIVYRIHLWYEVAGYRSDITLTYLLRLSPLPFVMAFFFMTSSYLVHRFWLSRLKSLLILWQVIGLAGFCGFVLMTFVFRPSNLYRLPDLWMRWLIGMILVVFVNLVYGLVIELAARHYLQDERHSFLK